jgi:hypothetical protein
MPLCPKLGDDNWRRGFASSEAWPGATITGRPMMRAHTIATTRLALLLSLLALGALGLVACGGGDDDQTTAAFKTKTTRDEPAADSKSAPDELAADNKSCGYVSRWKLVVVVGDVPCRVARGVMRGNIFHDRTPGFWICYGSETDPACINEAHRLNETVGDPSSEMILAWCCGEDQQEAYIAAADNLRLGASDRRYLAMGDPDPAVLEALRHHAELLEQMQELRAKLSREQVQELMREGNTETKLSAEQVLELKREANDWARLFSRGGVCNKYTGQPICVGLSGSGPGVEVHATRVSAAYRTSFAGATVEDIKSVRILHVGWSDHPVSYAAVKFSNGEVVVFNGGGEWYSCAGGGSGCAWSIAEPDQNRRFLEAAAPRE